MQPVIATSTTADKISPVIVQRCPCINPVWDPPVSKADRGQVDDNAPQLIY